MRRFAFYFLTGFLAFASGIFITYQLQRPTPVETTATAAIEFSEAVVTDQSLSDNEDYSEEQFERDQMKCYQPLIGRWLKGSKIREGELERNSDGFCASNGFDVLPYLRDFNGDGKKELAIRTGCAMVGNCEFFIFQKTGKKTFRMILKVDMVQQFELLKKKTRGYFDLQTRTHGSATSGDMTFFNFNGREYKANKCFDYDYVIHEEKTNRRITLSKPLLEPIPCSDARSY